MIASRFRSVGWVAGVAVAALSCYLVSQRVASERAMLNKVERRILLTQREIRQLQTEMGTRGGLRQLEKWNQEVLALQAPKAEQFLEGSVQLASWNKPAEPLMPSLPEGGAAEAAPPTEVGPKVVQAAYEAPKKVARPASAEPAPTAVAAQPMLRQATYLKPKGAPVAAEPQRVALLGDDILGELGRLASKERTSSKKVDR